MYGVLFEPEPHVAGRKRNRYSLKDRDFPDKMVLHLEKLQSIESDDEREEYEKACYDEWLNRRQEKV